MSIIIIKSADGPVRGNEIIKPSDDAVAVTNISEKYFGRTRGDDGEPHFRLDESFISRYRQRQPAFGFNGLGEFVFYRTYARVKPDGTRETFLDTIRRVVEGCYEVQKRHCRMLHIPWTESKAQLSAQEMFDRIWSFKFLPPGRGLWMMGTPFMWERGGAALNNCFRGDTEIITRDGIRPIGSLVGTVQELLTTGGRWVRAAIRSFGRQRLCKLTLERAGVQKVVYATPNHRWFACDLQAHDSRRRRRLMASAGVGAGTISVRRRKKTLAYSEVLTKDLKETHVLRHVFERSRFTAITSDPLGITHGIAYGAAMVSAHAPDHTTAPDTVNGGKQASASNPSCPPPPLRATKHYLYGWLAGCFAACGRIASDGVRIRSSSYDALMPVRDVCAILGIGTYPITQSTIGSTSTNGRDTKQVWYEIGLVSSCLRSDFFLCPEHRSGFKRIRRQPVSPWKVRSVEMTEEVAEVFCPQVPGTGAFALADDILTGNCGFVSTSDLHESDPAEPFCFLMDMAMLGVGIGFDTSGAGRIRVNRPNPNRVRIYQIPDSREGWVDSVRHLIRSYTIAAEDGIVEFDYSLIRKAGEPIRGFGGKASGPGLIRELHILIRAHLEKLIGRNLSSVDITDIMNYIGRCVVAGNVRRTAEIAFGDADDEAYCSMKNPTATLLPEDLEAWYRITGKVLADKRDVATLGDFDGTGIPRERLIPAIETWNALISHRWASNNSVFAKVGMDYHKIGRQIATNGEPGIIWLDNVRDFGRFIDGRQPGIDGRVMGANPCFSGDMRLLTADHGYVSLRELWDRGGRQEYDHAAGGPSISKHGQLMIVNRSGVTAATNVYRTSTRAGLFRVRLSDGSWIDATENHTFIVMVPTQSGWKEIRKPLCTLQIGDMVPSAVVDNFPAGQAHQLQEAYAELAGWWTADGAFSTDTNGLVYALCLCRDTDIYTVAPRLQELLQLIHATDNVALDRRHGPQDWPGNECGRPREWKIVDSIILGCMLRDDGVVPGGERRIPHSIWAGRRGTVAAFIRGLVSAAGGICIDGVDESIAIKITMTGERLLLDVRLLLSQFGIVSSVGERPEARLDGHGRQASHELVISGSRNVRKFIRNIGFIQQWKNQIVNSWLSNSYDPGRSATPCPCSSVKSIEFLCEAETFCLTEPVSNEVIVEGHCVGQCMEQSLESYELCVSGDTKLQLRNGVSRIDALVGKPVEVWNGSSWSEVTPRITGYNRELYRVHLSDGSYLDVTANHNWSVKPAGENTYRCTNTLSLQPGDLIQSFSLGAIRGKRVGYAFKAGYVVGSTFASLLDELVHMPLAAAVCGREDGPQALCWRIYERRNADCCGDIPEGPFAELQDDTGGLPQWAMDMDYNSILQFLAGWIEAGGAVVRYEDYEVCRIYGNEAKVRDLQLLLRRVGINHASISQHRRTGQTADADLCQSDLWYVQIGWRTPCEIPVKAMRVIDADNHDCADPHDGDHAVEGQYVVAVKKLPGRHTTYCFDEPHNHMGVFGNVLTYQCNLVETFPANHEDVADYMRTLKFAYLYAKTVTLIPTHNPRTNQVTLRNRRIGLSQTGIVQAFAKFGRRTVLRDFCDAGYNEIRRWDQVYSDWLCVPRSIKVTSVKPSGTVSLIAGATPGIHYPEARAYWRRVRLARDSLLVRILQQAGYHIEPAITDKDRTAVVTFGISDDRVRAVTEVSIWEQMQNAADYQKYWADNQVSCTIKFKPHEAAEIPLVLEAYEDQLKGISFLPHTDHGYPQAPYEPCSPEEVAEYNSKLRPVDYSAYIGETVGSKYCDADSCTYI